MEKDHQTSGKTKAIGIRFKNKCVHLLNEFAAQKFEGNRSAALNYIVLSFLTEPKYGKKRTPPKMPCPECGGVMFKGKTAFYCKSLGCTGMVKFV